MFGFVVGTASLIGLVAVLRHGRWHHGHRHGPGRPGRRARWMFRWLFQQLDTTPGQEKVFQSAADDLEGRAHQLRTELEQLGQDLGKALRAPVFDGGAVRESFARLRAHLDTLEESVIGHGAKLHEALDESQRDALADLLERGPHRLGRRCGPGHHHSHAHHAGHRGWTYA